MRSAHCLAPWLLVLLRCATTPEPPVAAPEPVRSEGPAAHVDAPPAPPPTPLATPTWVEATPGPASATPGRWEAVRPMRPLGGAGLAQFTAAMARARRATFSAEELAERREAERNPRPARARRSATGDMGPTRISPSSPATASSAPLAGPLAQVAATNAPSGGASITNNQVVGVDEGDIVKNHGADLVVLRRGRLFVLRTDHGALRRTAAVNAWPAGAAPGDYYDEMLVHRDDVLVLGLNTERGASEVHRFHLTPVGGIQYRESLYVRSSDYYSSENYATRVVGDRLVVYVPTPLFDPDDYYRTSARFSAVRGRSGAWRAVADAAQVYGPVQRVGYAPTAHTVLSCDLRAPGFACRARVVIGPEARSFYVSRDAVYLWAGGEDEAATQAATPGALPDAMIYRLPLAGGAPGAVAVRGGPVNQFSFDEGERSLRVLLRANSEGDGMWRNGLPSGALGLLEVPLARFTDGVSRAPEGAYTDLPAVPEGELVQRFAPGYLLYGNGSAWSPGAVRQATLVAHALRDHRTWTSTLPHGVDRIELLGAHALAAGASDGGLRFTAMALGDAPAVASQWTLPEAAQAETRSHGFFYRPAGERDGVFGLPVSREGGGGAAQLREGAARVLFVRVRDLQLSSLGALSARPTADEGECETSCDDWYGNARPIFLGDRVFALMGYELVEGRFDDDAVVERGRLDFTPRAEDR